jgi:hypothetical protein
MTIWDGAARREARRSVVHANSERPIQWPYFCHNELDANIGNQPKTVFSPF